MENWLIYLVSGFFFSFLVLGKRYFNGPAFQGKPNLSGKIIFITGASAGLGAQTAIELAKLGATLILACRDTNKAKKVILTIKKMVFFI